jgi:hypothetical protein
MRSVALLVLAAAAVVAVPAAHSDSGVDWTALHRPLQLPSFTAGQPCPTSAPAPEITGAKYGVGGAVGTGPVYALTGAAAVVTGYRPAEWGRGPWAGQKVLWFVRPDYAGPVLIRGRRLGGWQWLRFDRGSKPADEIRIEPGETVTWSGQAAGSRGRPSYVRVRAPGCYAVQIDGTTFSTVAVISVALDR